MTQPPPPPSTTSASLAPPLFAQEPQSSTSTPSVPIDKFSQPDSEPSRSSHQSSDWNKLLQYNRQTRLAQGGGTQGGWDYSTGMYHVPVRSKQYWEGVERAPIDPNAPPTRQHPTSVTVSAGGDKDFELSGDETGGGGGGTGKGYHDSGRPKRSRQAMTRG
ncbi:hypothetical protein JCM16303_001218 [Sporobolomyces ruberrimus]